MNEANSVLTFDPRTNSYRQLANSDSVDAIIQKMLVQGLTLLAAAGTLWVVSQLVKAWAESQGS